MAKRRTVSIRDVARESHASLTTVSLVLNRREGRISEETRNRVIKTADRLGYRPSRLAQGLQSQKSGLLAILVPQIRHAFADVYFGELISAIQETAAGRYQYKVLLEVANQDYIETKQYLELFHRHYIDGLLCLGVTNRDTYLRDFDHGRHPMLVVNNYLEDIKLNNVLCDYQQAGRLAGEHLVDLGHRKIALIYGATEVQTTADLRKGFEAALNRAKIKLPKKHTNDGLYTEEGGAVAAAALMKLDPSITAILAGNDKMAIGAISGLKSLGLRVPDDVSVVGCDDMHQAEFCDPPLTTVHTPLYEVGQRACECLMELINGQRDTLSEVHPVTMTIRKSTAPPKTTG
ncbi:MAG: LacI family transcriptional regulator [Phycisphaerales bacterium]|nr:LacI family transcriptional regulator [Phycisphaerales bacterium]